MPYSHYFKHSKCLIINRTTESTFFSTAYPIPSFDPIENCILIKYLNYWSLETSSATIKSRIKSYLLFCFFFFMYLTRVARKRKAVIAGRWRRVLRGFGEPSQFRGAICSFAFLRRNVRYSVVHFARRARFCSHRAGCSPAPYAHNYVHRATTRNRNEEMQNLPVSVHDQITFPRASASEWKNAFLNCSMFRNNLVLYFYLATVHRW